VESVDTPNIILHPAPDQAVFFDVLCEHDPSGTPPGESVEGTLRVQCWVNRIAAHDPEEAGRKAERFLTETRGVRNIIVKCWRFFLRSRQQKGVKPDGTLFT
jgi:hypothetical protein